MPHLHHFDVLEQSTPRNGIERRRILRHGPNVTAVPSVSAGLAVLGAPRARS